MSNSGRRKMKEDASGVVSRLATELKHRWRLLMDPEALQSAAVNGELELIEFLLQNGAPVNGRDKHGRTVLWYAAGCGQGAIVECLLQNRADVDAKDDGGETALVRAAWFGSSEVVTMLLQSGAVLDATCNDGRTALSWAAGKGRTDVVALLLERGACVDAACNEGRTALSWAAENGHFEVVAELLRVSAEVGAMDKHGRTALSWAAQTSRSEVVGDLLRFGADVDARDNDGRTPLFYAVAFGQLNIVRFLIDKGASVSAKSGSSSSHSRRESETLLTLAGRTRHMPIFQALLDAGAPVNVRSGVDGETPLVSAARWDYFAGVQLLISRGGCLRYDGVAEDEYPLFPGTLETMRRLCTTTFEFESMCARVVERLWSQLQQWDSPTLEVQEGALVSFASVIYRVCRLLLDIETRQSVLSRFIGSRAITSRIQDFHEELDHFSGVLDSEHKDSSGKAQCDDELSLLQSRFEKMLSADETLLGGFGNTTQKIEASVLLQYELKICGREGKPEVQERTKRVLDKFVRVFGIEAPAVPDWFASRNDLDFHSWNIVRSTVPANIYDASTFPTKLYEGKWRKSGVTIETSDLPLDTFGEAASQWYKLSHPHVVKLFGACHIGLPRLFVYETIAEGKPLRQFLNEESNRVWTWKSLYEAALGLQYLHNRDVVLGELRSENIIVGSDLTTKLCGTGPIPFRSTVVADVVSANTHRRQGISGSISSSDLLSYGNERVASAASNIYEFGLCICEAITLKLPSVEQQSRQRSRHKVASSRREGFLIRPPEVDDPRWDLISRMCTFHPDKRVNIAYVVNQLKQFALENAQTDSITQKYSISKIAECEQFRHQAVDECWFAVLDDTIPNSLRSIRLKCEQFPDDHWMVKSVYPALEFIFTLLRGRGKTPSDVEVVKFCAALSGFQRHLRTGVSENSVFRIARSRTVAETHHVVYSELDRLLDMLDIPENDSIRVWRHDPKRKTKLRSVVQFLPGDTSSSKANAISNAVSLHHFEMPASRSDGLRSGEVAATATSRYMSLRELVFSKKVDEKTSCHERWTRAGLAWSKSLPTWYISLRDLVFSEWDAIGRGSFGTVYKGSWLDTPVVVKFMGYEEDLGAISTDLILHEVRVWHRLSHPHVLKLYGACHVDKRYLVCEYASNGALLDFLKKPGNEHLKWRKVYESALGLQYLHSQNVAHNDLKCDNIMVGTDCKAKLIDFGLSCLLDEAEIQIDVKQMGAVNWRSPEYLAGERPSFASDVYSFAMCIVETVSGSIPWGRPMSPAQMRFQWKKGNGPALPDSMTEKQKNLVRLMTKVDPVERVKIGFVVDKLGEIAEDQIAKLAPSC